ncbi:GYF domain containing protein [Trichomonas vaginalis G3]|uniref:GYF domain containing protein n=1 Tax=Trichomonas vaginalis (strain ATCC PRA-98 / G3) TaxID=412133 RepID=A2F7C7_TRIV3|nr:GYF domain family [Trichomonas vaginalis G3]EAX99195.1 GYF domain containing protein [Trichomonas vaginalis G3]KAI5487966.1 GYF domain family [Trichomonas vaginalis G3]|eukprot:XP_001312125.1 GYF domain containing protein [Trichomonas vaginalis G3]
MASVKYTRKELISFYSDKLPLPEDFNKIKGIFLNEPIKPQLLANETLNLDGSSKRKLRANEVEQQNANKNAPKATVSAPSQWFYADPTQKIYGPYSADQMRHWWEKKNFPQDLKVSLRSDPDSLRPISEVFGAPENAFMFNPSMFPYILASPVEPDPLQKLVLDFDA